MFFRKLLKNNLILNNNKNNKKPEDKNAENKKQVKSIGTFTEVELAESTDVLCNPVRGWYQVHTFSAQEDFCEDIAKWSIAGEDSLAMMLYDIGAYRNRELDEGALQKLADILQMFQDAGKDVIVRIVYDTVGKGMEREPDFFSLVEKHIQQCIPVLNQYASNIFIYQGILVGSWGEMHSSKFLMQDKIKRMEEILSNELEGQIFLAVRKPAQWRMCVSENDVTESSVTKNNEIENSVTQSNTRERNVAKKCMSEKRLGMFDDGIFGSDTHLGTFGDTPKEQAKYEDSWIVQDELEFLAEQNQNTPYGGEVIFDEKFAERIAEEELAGQIDTLKKLQCTYLNRCHDTRLLDIWKNQKIQNIWNCENIWNQSSVYEYITAHLGYRYVCRQVRTEWDEKVIRIFIEMHNVGFARCYEEVQCYLETEWETSGQINCQCRLMEHIGKLKPGEQQELRCEILIEGQKEEVKEYREASDESQVDESQADESQADESQTNDNQADESKTDESKTNENQNNDISCKLYLLMKRKKDNKIVYPANETDHRGRIYLGEWRRNAGKRWN